MMKLKDKWFTVLACFIVLLLCACLGLGNKRAAGGKISTADDLKGARLAGVTGRMPDNSASIFFESMTGRKPGRYNSYANIDECLYALRSGKSDVIWTTDVTAEYLLKTNDDLAMLDNSDMAAIQNTKEPRFGFGMAVKNGERGEKLIKLLNYALSVIEKSGTLDELCGKYIENAAQAEKLTEKDMVINDSVHKKYYSATKPLKVGVTGAVPPLEMIDANGKPYGFCVALMDEIGQLLQSSVEFVVLDNETAFTALMSGKVDIIFAYGAGKITTEGSSSWLMTISYYNMQDYCFLYLK